MPYVDAQLVPTDDAGGPKKKLTLAEALKNEGLYEVFLTEYDDEPDAAAVLLVRSDGRGFLIDPAVGGYITDDKELKKESFAYCYCRYTDGRSYTIRFSHRE